MFNRKYFFTVESLATLRAQRREAGLVTVVSGFVHHRSFFSNPEKVRQFVLKKVANPEIGFNEDEILMTSLARV